ncbi:CapA family protein [Streptomyces sp. NBC_00454]|uniref:CapA family protein n=1 Tax=Streptomyces sp. NBC_00454 TaxID=2975747 RepID=UPI0030E23FB9
MTTRILAAVGDVLIDRLKPGSAFDGILPVLASADIVFGNFEGVLAENGRPAPGMSTATIVSPENAGPLAIFDVMSLANNHAMDAGYEGLAETIATLSGKGVRTVGAGPDLETARRPVTLRGGPGSKAGAEGGQPAVAFVAMASVMVVGTQAGPATPGVAPLRAEDCYTAPFPGHLVPGAPAKVVSVLNEHDWAEVEESVRAAKEEFGLVVVSVHWGDHTRPWVITEHERLCAELLVEAGADLILGHHHHLLRGVQFIEETPVFFGLGHMVFDLPRQAEELRARGADPQELDAEALAEVFGEYGIYPRPDSPAAFPFHPDARITAIAIIELEDTGTGRTGLVPCLIDEDGTPQVVSRDHPRFGEVLAFLRTAMSKAGPGTDLLDDGAVFADQPLLVLRAQAVNGA